MKKVHMLGCYKHICFVDFSQIYDSVNRENLWRAPEDFEILTKRIHFVKE